MAPPHDLRRPFKRPAISDQQKRRDLALLRQAQHRRDAQLHARTLASSIASLQDLNPHLHDPPVSEPSAESEPEPESEPQPPDFSVVQASRLRGSEARRWFARQLMLPEWMIDVPPRLNRDWLVLILFHLFVLWFGFWILPAFGCAPDSNSNRCLNAMVGNWFGFYHLWVANIWSFLFQIIVVRNPTKKRKKDLIVWFLSDQVHSTYDQSKPSFQFDTGQTIIGHWFESWLKRKCAFLKWSLDWIE